MSHGIMTLTSLLPAAIFARGKGQTQSIWHQAITEVPVLDQDELLTLPPEITPTISLVGVIDSETFNPVKGISLIKAEGFSERLGQAGGNKRTSWTPMQPERAAAEIFKLRELGATIEGAMWIAPGRFIIEGQMPLDTTRNGLDRHEWRFSVILNFTGSGADRVLISGTRVVCANTEMVANWDAKSAGSVLRVTHSKDIESRYQVDVPAFFGKFSDTIKQHADAKVRLNEIRLGATSGTIIEERDAFFDSLIGGKPNENASNGLQNAYARKMQALRGAYQVERDNAIATGIDPDSARVLVETASNVASHGGIVTINGQEQHRFILGGGHSDAARALNLLEGKTSGANALELALATYAS